MPILIFLMTIFSSPLFGEWTKVIESTSSGNQIYVDFDSISMNEGFLYYYSLTNYKKPVFGDLSIVVYTQADCKLSREKGVRWIFYKGQMGDGESLIENTQDQDWTYPSSSTSSSSKEVVLAKVCDYIVTAK